MRVPRRENVPPTDIMPQKSEVPVLQRYISFLYLFFSRIWPAVAASERTDNQSSVSLVKQLTSRLLHVTIASKGSTYNGREVARIDRGYAIY